MEPPSLVASAAFAKIPLESKRGPSSITVWQFLSSGAFTQAKTGLVAQMKLSCLIVFGKRGKDGEGAHLEMVFPCLNNQKTLEKA